MILHYAKPMKIRERVWALWPSVQQMALDLDESVVALGKAKLDGRLPDPRHDQQLLLRARALGRRLKQEQLDAVRQVRPEIILADRREIIQGFYDACGGVAAVRDRTLVDRNQLYVNKTRGFLNSTTRDEYLAMAAEVGFTLPEQIFNRPTG